MAAALQAAEVTHGRYDLAPALQRLAFAGALSYR